MSSWEDLQKADDLIDSLRSMDRGEVTSTGFDVNNSVASIGARSIHYLVGVNQLVRSNPELKDHLTMFPGGFLSQALRETIRVLSDEVGGYRKNDLLIQYGLHDIE